jgi:flavin reductase (DIM6/NTAB) family NADH-FMN oxidoreductase RutF
MSSLDSFKLCMRHLPTGVTVITTQDAAGMKEGVTINTFTSVSLNPLLILFSLKKTSFCYDVFISSKFFTVNVLSEYQHKISNLFTKVSDEKWDAVRLVSDTKMPSPAFKDSVAFLECETEHLYDGGDHTIIVGRVVNSVYQNTGHDSLVYYNGQYLNPK